MHLYIGTLHLECHWFCCWGDILTVVTMSSYKVLPPYGDLGADYYSPLLMEPDVVYSASTDDFGQVSLQLLTIIQTEMWWLRLGQSDQNTNKAFWNSDNESIRQPTVNPLPGWSISLHKQKWCQPPPMNRRVMLLQKLYCYPQKWLRSQRLPWLKAQIKVGDRIT